MWQDGDPGFTKQPLAALEEQKNVQHKGKKIRCSLLPDEVAIRKHVMAGDVESGVFDDSTPWLKIP